MTLADRCAAFRTAYAKWPASWPYLVKEQGRDVLYATWLIGAMWGSETPYYGSYPRTYLARVMALFPPPKPTLRDRGHEAPSILHVFSGSVPAGPYVRLDINPECGAELVGSVYDLGKMFLGRRPFRLVLADPAYSAEDSQRYGTDMINRLKATKAVAAVTKPGGHMVWLDTCWPQFKKTQWATVGRITIIRSTNHRVRLCSIFERAA